MPLRLGPLRIPWPGSSEKDDPYWESFIRKAPHDPRNLVSELVPLAPEGPVNPHKEDLHSAEITATHLKDLAAYLGADLTGIVKFADPEAGLPFGVVCAVGADYDPSQAPGVGGQVPVQNGQFVTFTLAAYIRELGYRASAITDPDAARVAAAAGLGHLDAQGRLTTLKHGTKLHVADVVHTDLPLAEDGTA